MNNHRRQGLSSVQILASAFAVLVATVSYAVAEVPTAVSELIDSACVQCHDAGSDTGLELESMELDLSDRNSFRRWVQVLDMAESGEMPPASEERPNPELLGAAIQSLSDKLHTASLTMQRETGRVPARRLTKREYGYAIQDLLGITADVTANLPEESESGSFDTVGKSQRLSAVHMEGFLKAADVALNRAIQLGKNPYRQHTFDLEGNDFLNSFHEKPLQLGGNISRRLEEGVVVFRDVDYLVRSDILGFHVTEPGTYQLRTTLEPFQAREPITYKLVVKEPSGGARIAKLGDLLPDERQDIQVDVYLRPADSIYVTLESDDAAIASLYLVGAKNFRGAGLAVRSLEMQGPMSESWPPESTRELLAGCELKSETSDGPFRIELSSYPIVHVREVVSRLAAKAFRRPATTEELDSFVALAVPAIEKGLSFEEAVQIPLRAILTSPQFLLFGGETGQLDGCQLASRLSFFLWKSVPDAQLNRLASSGEILNAEVMASQVERMLGDPKSQRFVTDFLGQWLRLYKINVTSPDSQLYPEFDELLGWSLPRETQLFFSNLVEDNLPVRNLIDSDYTYLNRRLAQHYGIEGVDGQHFRRFEIPDGSHRGGVLTQAAVLKTTANGTATSPVTRGNFVLTNFLGMPPSPPPPNVGSIEPDTRGKTTIREILDAHRNNESCNRCHRVIDPPGFALECFDPVGAYRIRYRASGGGVFGFLSSATYHYGPEVDASGQTAKGQEFEGIGDYKRLLLNDERQVAKNFVSQLIVYSTGGEIDFADREVVDAILDQTKNDGYSVRDIIHAVAQSRLFRDK